ncbi:MAG: hypothetical protein ACR2L4_04065 [Actinomycetota bacterium]
MALLVAFWLVDELRNRAVPLWIDVGNSLETSLLYLGPIVASATAFQSVREGRGALRELLDSTPRADVMRSLVLVLGELVWGIAVLLVVTLWLLVVTGLRASYGGPDTELIAAGFGAVAAFASIGFLAGRLLPSFVTPPLVGLGAYLGIWLTGVGETPFRLLSPLIDGEPTPLLPFPPSVGLLQTSWFLCLAVVAFGIGILWREASAGVSVVTLIAGALALLSAVGLVARGQVFVDSVGVNYASVCRSRSGIDVCIHPAYASVADQAAVVAARTLRPIKEATGWPTRTLQVGLMADAHRIEQLEPTTLGFTTSPVGAEGFEETGFSQGLAFAALGFDKCDRLDPDDPVRVGLAIWLIERADPGSAPIEGLPMTEWLNDQPPTIIDTWLETYLGPLRACDDVALPSLG